MKKWCFVVSNSASSLHCVFLSEFIDCNLLIDLIELCCCNLKNMSLVCIADQTSFPSRDKSLTYHSVQYIPISAPSWKIQSMLQPTSVNTAVKKGVPARMLFGVLHSNLALTSCDPTHTPAGSKFGVSSSSHSRARRVRV